MAPLMAGNGNSKLEQLPQYEFYDAYATSATSLSGRRHFRGAASADEVAQDILQDLWKVDVWMEQQETKGTQTAKTAAPIPADVKVLEELHQVDVEMTAARHVQGMQSAWKPSSVQRDVWTDLWETDWVVEAAKKGKRKPTGKGHMVDPYTTAGKIPTTSDAPSPPVAQVLLDLRTTDELVDSRVSALSKQEESCRDVFAELLAVDRLMDAAPTTRVGPLYSTRAIHPILHDLWAVDQQVDRCGDRRRRRVRQRRLDAAFDSLYEVDRWADGRVKAGFDQSQVKALLDLLAVDREVEARKYVLRGHAHMVASSFWDLYKTDCWVLETQTFKKRSAHAELLDPFADNGVLAETPAPTQGLADVLELLRTDELVDGNLRHEQALRQVYDLWQTDRIVTQHRQQRAAEQSTVEDSMAALFAMDRRFDEAQGFTVVPGGAAEEQEKEEQKAEEEGEAEETTEGDSAAFSSLADSNRRNIFSVQQQKQSTIRTATASQRGEDKKKEVPSTSSIPNPSRRSIFSSKEKAMAAKASGSAAGAATTSPKKVKKIRVTTPQGEEWRGTFTPSSKRGPLKSQKTGRIANPSHRPAPISNDAPPSSRKRAMARAQRGLAPKTTRVRGQLVPATPTAAGAEESHRRLPERAKKEEDACHVM